jgi:hypothetical protein
VGDRSRFVSIATVLAAIGLCFVTIGWVLMTLIMLAMLRFLGSRHPPVLNEYEPLGAGRVVLACFAIVMFVLCFTPVPLQMQP